MNCSKCGQPVADGSAFCSRCGAAVAPLTPAAPPPPPLPETEIWTGRFSGKSMGAAFVALFAYGVAIVALLVIAPDLPRWLPLALGVSWSAIGAILVLRLLFERLSTRYRLTTERLFEETGLWRREVREIELVRVDDVSFSQSVVERIFDVGSISIASTDADEPRLVLRGISAPEPVKEMIRAQTKRLRQGSVNVARI
jgi:uncharacterized membrane protein YdbT with pleckstrin-like domain